MGQAEAAQIALGPLEVVEQAPGKVALDRHAGSDGLAQRHQMALQIGQALLVVHAALGGQHIVEGGAVFGQLDDRRLVVALDAGQQVDEALGRDFPAEAGALHAVALDEAGTHGAAGRVILHPLRVVVIHAEEVGRGGDGLQVARRHMRGGSAEQCQRVFGIAAAVQGIQEPAVAQAVMAPHRGQVLGAVGGGGNRMQAQRDADLGAGRVAADQRHRLAVRQQHMVAGLDGVGQPGAARCMHALPVAHDAGAPGFVVRDPVLDAVAQATGHQLGVVEEGADGVARDPAALLLQCLGQVPVVEGAPGVQAAFEHAVHQPVVEREPRLVRHPPPLRQHARPGDRETVGVDAQRPGQVQVLRPAVVVVAGHQGIGAIADAAGLAAEAVPDGLALAVGLAGTLDLEGRRGHAPAEIGGEIGATQCDGHGMEPVGRAGRASRRSGGDAS
mmetsp:Transcript_5758/g.22365  ORF Transcript_5758/g.22365 Transcript_5758/m.22365 type:complete len:444 (+) Transcript_5758:3338-4669(+)